MDYRNTQKTILIFACNSLLKEFGGSLVSHTLSYNRKMFDFLLCMWCVYPENCCSCYMEGINVSALKITA